MRPAVRVAPPRLPAPSRSRPMPGWSCIADTTGPAFALRTRANGALPRTAAAEDTGRGDDEGSFVSSRPRPPPVPHAGGGRLPDRVRTRVKRSAAPAAGADSEGKTETAAAAGPPWRHEPQTARGPLYDHGGVFAEEQAAGAFQGVEADAQMALWVRPRRRVAGRGSRRQRTRRSLRPSGMAEGCGTLQAAMNPAE